jgi:hypothetical protein
VKSYSQRFEQVVGQSVRDYLQLPADGGNGRSV